MKKILSLILVGVMIMSLAACGIVDTIKENISGAGTGLEIYGEKLNELLDKGFAGLDEALKKTLIQGTATVTSAEANSITLKDDCLVLVVPTDNILKQMEQDGLTTETIQKEQQNAATAKLEYELQYQYMVKLAINGTSKTAIAVVPVTLENMNQNVEITVPIKAEEMSVTVYELLEGGSIAVESCLQHGTEATKACSATYYLDNVPDGKTGTKLVIVDERSTDAA